MGSPACKVERQGSYPALIFIYRSEGRDPKPVGLEASQSGGGTSAAHQGADDDALGVGPQL